MVLAAAYAHELPRYGLEVGLTNYAAGILSLGLFKLSSVIHSPILFLTFAFEIMISLLYWASSGPPAPENA